MQIETMKKLTNGHLDLNFAKHVRNKEATKMALNSLDGYKIETDIDRKLLLGLWKQEEDDRELVTAKQFE